MLRIRSLVSLRDCICIYLINLTNECKARNAFLLTLILEKDDRLSIEKLWDIYYHLFIDKETASVIQEHITKLLSLSQTPEEWSKSIYGRAVHFCDADTLADVRRIWQRIQAAAEQCQSDSCLETFGKNVKASRDCREMMVGAHGSSMTSLRSAAPLSLQTRGELFKTYQQYWNEGTVTPRRAEEKFPNPLLASLLSENEILHYGSDPVLGFHLATAFAPLAETSPLKTINEVEDYAAACAAKTQFGEWISAFKTVFGKRLVVRFVVADALAFCQTLQSMASTGKSANLYRRVWDARPLRLDFTVYGRNGTGPSEFDVIDTSNLSDHIGALNILVAAGPLLKDEPWASLFTELLITREGTQKAAFEKLLCGHVPTVSLLLGFTPTQYWTNAKAESHVDEVFMGLLNKEGKREAQVRSRLAWKRDNQASGQASRGKLHIEAKPLARLIAKIYDLLFAAEDVSKVMDMATGKMNPYTHFNRASLAALIKAVMKGVTTDWPVMCTILIDNISRDKRFLLASNGMQDLCLQLHLFGVNTEQWLVDEIKKTPELGSFNIWNSIPPAVAVTLVVPREQFMRLYKHKSKEARIVSPPLVGSIRSGPTAKNGWHNMFGDVQIAFGTVKTEGSPNLDDFQVTVQQDRDGWLGNSSLIVSFYVPTCALQVEPKSALVGVCVPPTGQNSVFYSQILGPNMLVFETRLDTRSRVYFSKHMPGQVAYPVVCGAVKALDETVYKGQDDRTTKLLAEVAESESTLTSVTGHLDITSVKGRGLLKDKIPIELRQTNPFVIDIVFGQDKLVCPLRFPIPVTKTGSRTRIARTSGYIEVIAPFAVPASSSELHDFIFPSVLSASALPATLNTPHLNLDNLPIINVEQQDEMRWLITLTSMQFSAREKRLRNEADDESGISDDPRVNFKESLFTMFMLGSGLQGRQTGLFAINHPEKGGIHMLIFVSAMRLDGDAASVVLDAAVIPFTSSLIESRKLEEFLLILRSLECCTVNVNDAELILWKKALPALAERCRTWSHRPGCEYKRRNATIPLSLEPGEQVVCSCGNGKLPDDFVGLPEWDKAAPNAVRIAISPTYAVPFVEDIIDPADVGKIGTAVERCRNCSKPEGHEGTKLKKCARCQRAKYCSGQCQKKDWKKHRMECGEAE